MRCFEVKFVWRNILTVISKDCGFVAILCEILCACVFEIIVL